MMRTFLLSTLLGAALTNLPALAMNDDMEIVPTNPKRLSQEETAYDPMADTAYLKEIESGNNADLQFLLENGNGTMPWGFLCAIMYERGQNKKLPAFSLVQKKSRITLARKDSMIDDTSLKRKYFMITDITQNFRDSLKYSLPDVTVVSNKCLVWDVNLNGEKLCSIPKIAREIVDILRR